MSDKVDPIVEFREDHRKVRDSLLDPASAAEAGDMANGLDILGRILSGKDNTKVDCRRLVK